MAETPTVKTNELIGRTIMMPLSDLTKNFRDFKTKVKLRITSIDGNQAKTEYFGQEIIKDQLARLIRRWSSRIDGIDDVELKDGRKLRIKNLVISRRRVNTSVKSDIRKAVSEKIKKYTEQKTIDQVVIDINSARLQKEISREVGKIYPLKTVEIRMIEVLE